MSWPRERAVHDDDKLKRRAWVKMALLYQQGFRVLASRLVGVGLSVAQFDLLAQLVACESGPPKQSELAKRLLVTKGNVSGMVTRMVDQGSVKRLGDPKDKRSNRVSLTPQGRKLHEAGLKIQQHLVSEMFTDVNLETLRELEEVVSHIIEKLAQDKAIQVSD